MNSAAKNPVAQSQTTAVTHSKATFVWRDDTQMMSVILCEL